MPLVLHQLQDGVLSVSLNRPEKKNAVNVPLLEEFDAALARYETAVEARALVVRGCGGCFCAGADIRALNSFGPAQMRAFHDLRERVLSRIEAFPGPTMAVVEGFALGTGLELALSTDFRLAAEDALLGIPSSRLGVTESYPYIARLVRCVGLARTQFLVLTGERIGAAEARDIGLVERVASPGDLAAQADQLARTLAANAPNAMVRSKQIVRHCWEDPRLEGIDDPARPFVESAGGRELQEGTGAFLDKREARFEHGNDE
ncbi:MAG: enoyl-CoA hydratase/isomerase family protein [Proteobacteria bacterium]|nr:enoyl-CoA hydratase/isomerase family protein [Pseudomonadota bacterium]